jgi:hypothetical protein
VGNRKQPSIAPQVLRRGGLPEHREAYALRGQGQRVSRAQQRGVRPPVGADGRNAQRLRLGEQVRAVEEAGHAWRESARRRDLRRCLTVFGLAHDQAPRAPAPRAMFSPVMTGLRRAAQSIGGMSAIGMELSSKYPKPSWPTTIAHATAYTWSVRQSYLATCQRQSPGMQTPWRFPAS